MNEAAKMKKTTPSTANDGTILVVDDDSSIRAGLLTLFQRHGYRTLEAEDGHEAKDFIDEHKPDLVILDMMLPRWGGLAVLEHFQNHPAPPKFIMLSGHDGEKHKAYARRLGVIDYLHKPCSIQRMLQTVRRFFQASERAEKAGNAATSAESGTCRRILLVPEHQALLPAIRRRLEIQGYVVDTAEGGKDADFKARSFSYDVIVLGLAVPTIDGMTLLRNWRRDSIQAEILILTTQDSTPVKVAAFDAGADAFLTTPFEFEELLARVRGLVRRRNQVNSPVIRVHDLEINTASRIVNRSGQPISLTPQEYALLQLLAVHRGQVVTRSVIWNHLYDAQEDFSSNVIDVYIRYLRNKIDRAFDRKLILSCRGSGYMLCGDER